MIVDIFALILFLFFTCLALAMVIKGIYDENRSFKVCCERESKLNRGKSGEPKPGMVFCKDCVHYAKGSNGETCLHPINEYKTYDHYETYIGYKLKPYVLNASNDCVFYKEYIRTDK